MIKEMSIQFAIWICIVVIVLLCTGRGSFSTDKGGTQNGWETRLDGRSLEGWHPLEVSQPNDWRTCESVKLNSQDEHFFTIQPGQGILVNGEKGKTVNLVSDVKYGDVEVHVEFIVPKGSNSGVYFMGLYEVQVLDSYGKTDLAFSDCGGIYARWINEKSVGGAAPRVNASKPPGVWQSFDVQFRAPHFNANGKKVENARFLKVVHNGTVIHKNVEVDGPTRAAMDRPEAPAGPLMLQGDHGPVAYRNIRVRPLHHGQPTAN
jgi:hypothetical protein